VLKIFFEIEKEFFMPERIIGETGKALPVNRKIKPTIVQKRGDSPQGGF